MPNDLRTWFPKLDARNHRITSREDPGYNCVAWATCDSTRWWDHVCGYWPDGVTQDSSVEAYVELFREEGLLYLYDPAWIDDDDRYVDLDVHGILLTRKDGIESIVFTKLKFGQATPRRKRQQAGKNENATKGELHG